MQLHKKTISSPQEENAMCAVISRFIKIPRLMNKSVYYNKHTSKPIEQNSSSKIVHPAT